MVEMFLDVFYVGFSVFYVAIYEFPDFYTLFQEIRNQIILLLLLKLIARLLLLLLFLFFVLLVILFLLFQKLLMLLRIYRINFHGHRDICMILILILIRNFSAAIVIFVSSGQLEIHAHNAQNKQ